MNTHNHHVPGQAPDYTHTSQAFRHFDGSPCDWRRDRPADREFKRALKNYCKHVIPMAEMGNRIIDSPWLLVPMALTVLVGVVCIMEGWWK